MKQNWFSTIGKFINSNLMQLIRTAVILSLILVAAVGGNVWRMYASFGQVVTTEFELQKLAGEIVHLDEVLTMSARMAASTGSLEWEQRYVIFEPKLDQAIKRAIELAPEAYANQPAATDEANIKLVNMEHKSFDLVRQGKQAEALELLFSPEYQLQKQIYAIGINKTIAALETRINFNLDYYRRNLLMSGLFSLLSVPILLLAWSTILRLINWYVRQKKQAEITLRSAKLQLEKNNKTLEKKVKQRTAQLQEAKEKAEAANLAKDRFLANISHELRTPLNGILGYTNLMIRDCDESNNQKTKDLNIIKNSGLHLLTLIEDLLDYSKTDAGKMELHLVQVNLPSFLRETIDLVESSAREKGLKIELEKTVNLPEDIKADEKRLRQILINLLSNAIKFTQQGKITLKARAIGVKHLNSLQKIRFEVIDTGVGISQEKISTIFNPFEQVGDLKSKSAGTGLGLSISSQLVELMGGKLEVKSEVNKGSIFWFDVILTVLKTSLSQSPSPRRERSEIVGYQGRKRRILVVDDKQENRSLLTDILEPIGFEIISAENGQQMLDIAAKIAPLDLILLDLFMPVKTGFTAARELRSTPGLQNTPVIVISATLIAEKTRKYLDCDAYMNKPIDDEELFELLAKFLHLQWRYQIVS